MGGTHVGDGEGCPHHLLVENLENTACDEMPENTPWYRAS